LAFPSFSKLDSEGDIEGIRRVTFTAERYITMIIVPIVTLVVLFPTEIAVTIFGSQFRPAGDTMRFLAVDVAFTLLCQIYISQILGVNRPDINAKIILGSFVVNVALLIVFVPNELFGVRLLGMSYTGARHSRTIGSLTVLLWVRLIVKNLTGPVTTPDPEASAVRCCRRSGHRAAGHGVFPVRSGAPGDLQRGHAGGVLCGRWPRSRSSPARINHFFLDLLNPSKMLNYMGGEMKSKK